MASATSHAIHQSNLLRTPLHEWHVAHGGRMVEFAGWLMPQQYTSIIEEHVASRAGVGMADISHMGRLRLEGPGAAVFLAELQIDVRGRIEPARVTKLPFYRRSKKGSNS